MDIAKTVKVPIDIKDPHFTNDPAQQEGELHLLSKVTTDESLYYVFNGQNFFGHEVTVGFRADMHKDEDALALYFKVALCAPSDRFNPATGEEIVLGRLLKADKDEPRSVISVSSMSDSEINKTVTTVIVSFMSSFGETLFAKDEAFGLMDMAFDLQKRRFKLNMEKYI